MIKNIKMIVTDLDRTLLRSDKTISDYTVRVLEDCRKRGIKIVFATARSENSCKRYTDLVNPVSIVSNGGALVRIVGKTVYSCAICAEITNEFLQTLIIQPEVGYITVDTDEGYFVNKPIDEHDPGWIEYLPAHHADFSKGFNLAAYKIPVEIFDNSIADEIITKFPTIDIVPFSGEGWFCFKDKNADKLHGVSALAEHLGIDLASIAAFGDDFSDIEMLRECGAGVAVGNAITEVKSAAGYICGANDSDGVAKWIEERILK